MYYIRALAKIFFSAAAFLLLIFSVCVLGLTAYSLYSFFKHGDSVIPEHDLVISPFVGIAVLTSSLYILMGRCKWQGLISAGALLLLLSFCLVVLIASFANIHTPWAGDEINMSLGVGSYSLGLLVGVILKYRGFWDEVDKASKTRKPKADEPAAWFHIMALTYSVCWLDLDFYEQ